MCSKTGGGDIKESKLKLKDVVVFKSSASLDKCSCLKLRYEAFKTLALNKLFLG